MRTLKQPSRLHSSCWLSGKQARPQPWQPRMAQTLPICQRSRQHWRRAEASASAGLLGPGIVCMELNHPVFLRLVGGPARHLVVEVGKGGLALLVQGV